MIFEEEEKMNKTEKVLVKILENNEELEEFLKRKTMDGMYEFVLNKDSSISEEEFDESVAKLLEDYSLLGVKKVNENTLVNVSGGAAELGRKVTSAGLAALMLLPAFPPSVGAVNSGELQAIGGRLRKFASDSKEFISDKWKNTKECIKNHPIISATIATATTLAMITIVVVASRRNNPNSSSESQSSNDKSKVEFGVRSPSQSESKSKAQSPQPVDLKTLVNWGGYRDNLGRKGSKCGLLFGGRNIINWNRGKAFNQAEMISAVTEVGGNATKEGIGIAVGRVLNKVARRGGYGCELTKSEEGIYRFLLGVAANGYTQNTVPVFANLAASLTAWSREKLAMVGSDFNLVRDTEGYRLFPPHKFYINYDENNENLVKLKPLFYNMD